MRHYNRPRAATVVCLTEDHNVVCLGVILFLKEKQRPLYQPTCPGYSVNLIKNHFIHLSLLSPSYNH